MPQAIIFDIDGTLLDSVDLHAKAWQEALEHFGYNLPFTRVRTQIGKGGDQLLPELLGNEEAERRGKEIQEFRGRLFKDKYLSQVKPFAGVRALFERCLSNGQKIGLASSAQGDELKHYEEIAKIGDLVEVETSSADAQRSKPHPDILEAALDRLGPGIDRSRVLIVGDSPFDATAARKAGLPIVGVRCGGFPEDDLRAAGCTCLYDDPEDLLANYDSSPLAEDQVRSA